MESKEKVSICFLTHENIFISSPFGISAYIIMVRLKRYILFHHRLMLQKTYACSIQDHIWALTWGGPAPHAPHWLRG